MVRGMFQAGEILCERYRIDGVLSSGSFGVVYAAFDLEASDHVALKAMHKEALANEELVERFSREAEIGAQLNHANVARLRDLDAVLNADGTPRVPFLVFDRVPGVPLGRLLDHRGGLEVAEAEHVMFGLLSALEAAHAIGVLHRDIKPDNVLLQPPESARVASNLSGDLYERLGVPALDDPVWEDVRASSVKVVDFGLAKLLEVGDRKVAPLTRAGVVAGTAHYVSPEQVRGQKTDYRSDLYSAGILLYRLLTGATPFQGASATEVAIKHLTEPVPTLPPPLDAHEINAVIQRATAKRPEDRYVSAGDMRWATRCALDPSAKERRPLMITPPPIRRPTALTRFKRWLKG